MASQHNPSPNNVAPLGGVLDDASFTPTSLRLDPVTKRLKVDTNSENSGIGIPEYDYVSMALSGGDTTETYTFKTGGSGGTTVATVAVVYTTSTRDVLVSVTKT